MVARAGRLAFVLAGVARRSAATSGRSTAPSRRRRACPAGGLTPEQAARVLAKVGDRTITLGDYAATLERMDQFDRLRYQSPERRKELLDEIIDVELLAQDARQKKLDQQPETQQAVRQILRDAMLAEARRGLPAPADIPADEVRAYYEAHRDEFREPERRRVSHIVVKDKDDRDARCSALAKKANAARVGRALPKALARCAQEAGRALSRSSWRAISASSARPAMRAATTRACRAEVRAAVFELAAIGDVLGAPVQAEGGFHVVRMVGKTDAHERSLAEADRVDPRRAPSSEDCRAREDARSRAAASSSRSRIDEQALAKVDVPRARRREPSRRRRVRQRPRAEVMLAQRQAARFVLRRTPRRRRRRLDRSAPSRGHHAWPSSRSARSHRSRARRRAARRASGAAHRHHALLPRRSPIRAIRAARFAASACRTLDEAREVPGDLRRSARRESARGRARSRIAVTPIARSCS